MSEERCQIQIDFPKFVGGGSIICNRLKTDPCAVCKIDWNAIYNEYRDEPRVAVEGDIL